MATTTTLRPLTSVAPAGWTVTGAATVHAATNDNSDASYVTSSGYGAPTAITFNLDAFAIPAGSYVYSVTPRIRVRRPTGTSGKVYVSASAKGTNRLTGGYLASISRPGSAGAPPTLTSWPLLLVEQFIPVPLNSGAAAFTTYTGPTVYPNQIGPSPVFTMTAYLDLGMRTGSLVEVYLDVVTRTLGTVTVSTPTSPVTDTSRPVITSTVTDPEGDGPGMFRVLYESSVYSAPGFDPWLSRSVNAVAGWQTETGADGNYGNGDGTNPSYAGTTDLTNGSTYRVYAWPKYGGGLVAAVTQQFTINLVTPIAPSITAAWDPTVAGVRVNVVGHTNLLTTQQAGVEALGTTGFTVGTNCTLARTTGQFKSGVASLQVTATAAAGFSLAVTPTATVTDFTPVLGGTAYTFTFAARTAATARTVTPGIAWYDSSLALLSTTNGVGVTDSSAGWTVASMVATAPPTAVYAAPIVSWNTAAAAEVHYLDELSFYPGTAASSVNLLSDDYATFESGVTSLNAVFSSATITVSSVRAQHGTKSVLATWGAGTGGNLCGANFTGLTIGQTYTLSLYVWIVSGGTITLGSLLGTAPTFVGTPAGTVASTATTGAWVRLGYTFTATATTHNLGINAGAGNLTGQSAHVDSVQLETGATATAFGIASAAYSLGGVTSLDVLLQRSTDAGATWTQVRRPSTATVSAYGGVSIPSTTQAYTVLDSEAPRGTAVLYRAVSRGTYAGQTLTSAYSANTSVTTVNDGTWWLKLVADQSLYAGGAGGVKVSKGSLRFKVTEDLGVFRPLGKSTATVVAGDLGGEDGELTLEAVGDVEWATLVRLVKAQTPLLLQDPNGTQKYVRWDSDREWSRFAGAAYRRTVPVSYVEVGAP